MMLQFPPAARARLSRLLLSAAALSAAVPTGGGLAELAEFYQCCWNITSCDDEFSAAQNCAPVPGCGTASGCTNPSSGCTAPTPGQWCKTRPCDGKGNCASSNFDRNLRQRLRPPRQTAAQASSMANVLARAVTDSAAARPWALAYMGSPNVRGHLHPSLQHFSDEELLEMFTWEFQRLPLFHNAPADDWDVDRGGITDDSPMNISLSSGNLQQPCQRYVLGGPEDLFPTIAYASMYEYHFDLSVPGGLCELTSSLRKADDCMLYDANNLRKASLGNTQFGAVTYVLNTKALSGRSLFEPSDGGAYDLFMNMPPYLFRKYPTQGTIWPPAFYHLLQPHEAVFNIGGSYKSIATVFNSWWVPGAPFPDGKATGSSMMDGNPCETVLRFLCLSLLFLCLLLRFNCSNRGPSPRCHQTSRS